MKQILLSFFILIFYITSIAQSSTNNYSYNIGYNETEPIRMVNDLNIKGVDISYQFPGIIISEKVESSVQYGFINIKNFTHTKAVGKAALPSHNDMIAVPIGATAVIEITKAEYTVYNDYIIYPSLKPANDTYGSAEPEFERDEKFYSSDIIYPESPVEIAEYLTVRGMQIAVVQIRPVQYNPARSEIRVYSSIEYSVKFSGGSRFIDLAQHTDHFKSIYPAVMLNKGSLIKEIESGNSVISSPKNNNSRNYIIVTNSLYYDAAVALAEWKEQLGYSVELLSQATWSSVDVMNNIHSLYTAWEPKPDFFVIIGDNQDVPGVSLSGFTSDLYYSCMDGSSDYTPDMAYGRISVSSATEANVVVQKIINYEKYPVSDPNFYSKGLNCAYFQEAANGYAERRFAQTSEDVRNYMTGSSLGFDVTRVYVTGSSVYPTNWNNGYYSAG